MNERLRQWGWRLTTALGLVFHPGLAKLSLADTLHEALAQRSKKQLIYPIDDAAVTGGGGGAHYHHWDFAPWDKPGSCPPGERFTYFDQPVRAMMSGVVTKIGDPANRDDPEHSRLWLEGPSDNSVLVYEHLDDFLVEKGDRVNQGDPIAYISCEHRPTTRTTGPHVDVAWMQDRREVPFDGRVTFDGWEPHTVDGYYAGYLQKGAEIRWANQYRCGPDSYKNRNFWVEVCNEQRNDIENDHFWTLPITGPGNEEEVRPIPKPVPTPARPTPTSTARPQIVIPEIKIITNTPTPRPTNTPVPPTAPKPAVAIPQLACVQDGLIPGRLDNVPDKLDFRAVNVVIQSYNDLLCLTQGDRNSEEGMLVTGDFEQNPPGVKGIKWLDTHQVRWFRERRDGDDYRLINGQAVIEANFAVEHSRMSLSSTPPLLRYEVKLNPKYRYRYEVLRRQENQSYPNLPTGQFSGPVSDELYPFLLDLGDNLRWSAKFNPTAGHNPIKYPLKIMLTR